MGRKIFLTLLLLLSILLPSSHVMADEYPPDIQKIINRKKIIIAMFQRDQPPFFKESESGELEGFDVDLGKGIAEALGVEAEFNRTPETFNGTVDLVVNKKADIVISKLSKTLTRSKRVYFTNPYIVLRKGLLINRLKLAQSKKGKSTTTFIKSIRGDIGVIAGSSYVGFGKKMFPKAKIIEYPQWEDITDAVMKSEIIAGFRDELEIKKIIKSASDQSIKLQSVVFKDTKDPIAIAVSTDAPHLLFWLNQYLESLNSNMTADKLLIKFSYMFENKEKK